MSNKVLNKLLVLVCFLFGFFLKGFSIGDTSFVLQGDIKGYGDGKVVISYYNPNERIEPDTIPVKNDRFTFRGKLDAPMIVFAKVLNNGSLGREFLIYSVLMENTTVTLNGNIKDAKNFTTTGSASDNLQREIRKNSEALFQDFLKVEKEYKELTDSTAKAKLNDELESKKWKYFDYLLNYKGFYESDAGVYLLWLFSDKRIPWQKMDSILPLFNETLHHSVYYQHMERKLDAAKRIEPGRKASDFVVKDLNGRSYTLKDFKGNYLLATFSASWCGPCKYEYPYLVKAYEKFSPKGLQVVILNVDDAREKWEGDVKKYNFPFPILSNLEAFSGALTKNYGVMSIPKVFLIDPNGNIVSTTIRQQKILDELEKVYK